MKLPSAKQSNGRRRRGQPTSFLKILTGKWSRQHRLPAHVTGEGDWEVEVPQIRMSRAFAVMLLLHIVAVGGLFAFRIWGKDEEAKANREVVSNTEAPAELVKQDQSSNKAAAEPPLPEPSSSNIQDTTPVPAPAPVEVQKTYIWKSGDSFPLVAARFGISSTALRDANPGKLFVADAEIVIPKAGRVIDGVEVAQNAGRPSEFFNPGGSSTLPGEARPPRAEVVPEPVLADAGIPDVVPAPAVEVPRPVVQRVSTSVDATSRPANRLPVTKAGPEVVSKPKVKVSEPAVPPARTAAGQKIHVVGKGDTVFNIARRYGLSGDDIARANGLGSDSRIRMGQQLRIPVRR